MSIIAQLVASKQCLAHTIDCKRYVTNAKSLTPTYFSLLFQLETTYPLLPLSRSPSGKTEEGIRLGGSGVGGTLNLSWDDNLVISRDCYFR